MRRLAHTSSGSLLLPAIVLGPVGSRALPLPPSDEADLWGLRVLCVPRRRPAPTACSPPAHRGIQPSLSPRMHPPQSECRSPLAVAGTKKATIQYKARILIVK